LQAGQSRCTGSVLSLIFDETFHHGPVTTHLAKQIIEQGRFPHRTREQLLGRMQPPAYLLVLMILDWL
jgi:hypothetical protein